MKLARGAFALLLAGGLAACSDSAPSEPQVPGPQMSSHQTQTLITNVVGTLLGGTFTGTAQITNLAVQNGQLVVSGVLNGVATVGGVATNIVNQAFTTTASLTSAGTGRCDILNLDLGPLNLDLLGLLVDLSPVSLDVAAQPGPGNLLGNLLCAVANLLNNPLGNLAGLANLLGLINNLLG
ncbi:MAG TPA: hypothetical protein VFZ04_07250 [Longimicrobiales bacterium]